LIVRVLCARQPGSRRCTREGLDATFIRATVPPWFSTVLSSLSRRLTRRSYVQFVTGALGHYTSDILALGEEGRQVFGKLRFHGYHQRELFGVSPTGRHVWWYGAPIFTFEGDLIRDLWVLGDIHGLIGRLKGESSAT